MSLLERCGVTLTQSCTLYKSDGKAIYQTIPINKMKGNIYLVITHHGGGLQTSQFSYKELAATDGIMPFYWRDALGILRHRLSKKAFDLFLQQFAEKFGERSIKKPASRKREHKS